jgi:hypothetical protein
MDHLFPAELDGLTPELQILRCHTLAAAAQQEAAAAPAHLKESFFEVAKGWLRLAKEITKTTGRDLPRA